LLTYDSITLAEHKQTDRAYEAAITEEFAKHHERFSNSQLPAEIKIILILLPMNDKAKLVASFDAKLKGMTL
jgi:hypothetical protein